MIFKIQKLVSASVACACALVLSALPAYSQFNNPRLENQLVQPFTNPLFNNSQMFGTQLAQTGTILPTDVVPLPAPHEGQGFAENMQLRVLQRLPAKFYLQAINEDSFRLETNPFQNPSRSSLQRKITGGIPIDQFSSTDQALIEKLLGQCNQTQQVFRTLPNITTGWEFTPRTRVYANYFAIRDSLMHNTILNATTQSVGGGVQHDFPFRDQKTNFQTNFQFRELFQTGQPNVFDYIPSMTLTRKFGGSTVGYLNALLQLRGKQPFCAPTREMDPFYTLGVLSQHGRWQFATSATFLQNFRQPFGRNALAPINNYSIICDFEVDRQLFKKFRGLQAFVRAEPIWNMHSGAAPGFSGFDFRLFYGLRLTLGKSALTGPIKDIKKQLEDQEVQPPAPLPGEPPPP